MDEDGTPVEVSLAEGIATVTFSDLRTRNALSAELVYALREALTALTADSKVRGLIITGAGRVFSSGHNLKELQSAVPETARSIFENTAALALQLRSLELPVVAALSGPAVGAGAQLALACDCIVAVEDSYFETAGATKGWFCFTPAVEALRRLPESIAREMVLTGARLSSRRACELGVVNYISTHEELLARCRELLSRMVGGSREMIALGKTFLDSKVGLDSAAQYAKAAALMAETLFHESAQRRIRG
ncbi:MAG: enoyl-CoA hydratase/isomerase family protein [Proteobacteria bacterium]|nr:enoyl-CoA hydratase/isomerase family protein [Pseudomonadota bacterium]